MHQLRSTSPSARWRRGAAALSALALSTSVLAAQAPALSFVEGPASSQAGLPPLIDRELFFGNPEISSATLSPDGRFVAFRKPWNDTLNIWVKPIDEPFDRARRLTAETKRPIPAFFWSRDSKYILFVQDQGGDENYNVYAVDASASAAAGKDVPPARNITEAKGVRAAIYDVPRNNPDLIHVGLNDRDAQWHDLYQVKISTGERKLLKQNTEQIAQWIFDRAGTLQLAMKTVGNGDVEILRVTDKGFEKVYGCNVFETCVPVKFHPDNKRVYMMTNRGDTDLIGLVLFDPNTKKEEFVESDPQNQVDLDDALFSEKTGELVGTVYVDDRPRIHFRDKSFASDYENIKKKLPGLELSFGGSTDDERKWMIVAQSDTEPGERYIYDRDKKTLTKQYRVFEKLPREHLATMKPVRYKSSDGLEIPAYLTLPKGVPAKGLPAVVVPHGGPWSRDTFGYRATAQFLANRGYAVLSPNFRGSAGYGEKFLNAGNLQWGDKMQDDVTWGAKYLIDQGIADPKRIAIMGGSYGGYATLAGVAFTPDQYAAGVSIVGPSSLITLLESIPPYWEAGRKMFHARMGDPTTPEGKKQLERQSPLFSAAKIKTPLLVIQGANDPRVKKAESDQIVIALRDRGFPVEYLVAPDEGHGFQRPVNNMAMFATVEKFLAKHLGGRFQESMTPEVAARLKEITVDPKTVKLTKAVDTSAVTLPSGVQPLVTGTSSYNAAISVAGQSMKIEASTNVKEDGNTWVITETAKTPMGDAVDMAVLDKATLALRSREVKQGPISVKLTVEGGKVTGAMSMGGQEKPISVDAGGALFADGPSVGPSIGALPLKEGYSITYRNFDVQKQKATLKQLKVGGLEEVTVPAGAFKTWKVQIASAEGEPGEQTLWVDTASRRVVKVTATLPQMGGATLTSELVK